MNSPQIEIPTIPGTPFAGGFYVGRILYYGVPHALVVAAKTEGERTGIAWHRESPAVPGALSFFDGLTNTQAMADAGSALATWAQGLRIGGHDDWYVPARDELELCYRHLKPADAENYCYCGDNPSSAPVGYAYMPNKPSRTDASEFQKGQPLAFKEAWYWSSTQCAGTRSNAWIQHFVNGSQGNGSKDYEGHCRAVRRFLIL